MWERPAPKTFCLVTLCYSESESPGVRGCLYILVRRCMQPSIVQWHGFVRRVECIFFEACKPAWTSSLWLSFGLPTLKISENPVAIWFLHSHDDLILPLQTQSSPRVCAIIAVGSSDSDLGDVPATSIRVCVRTTHHIAVHCVPLWYIPSHYSIAFSIQSDITLHTYMSACASPAMHARISS